MDYLLEGHYRGTALPSPIYRRYRECYTRTFPIHPFGLVAEQHDQFLCRTRKGVYQCGRSLGYLCRQRQTTLPVRPRECSRISCHSTSSRGGTSCQESAWSIESRKGKKVLKVKNILPVLEKVVSLQSDLWGRNALKSGESN